ncbi:hypothetical protein [Pseudonocardia sp. GCM10023141]|uniref:hypothetical protein n=1 Tax=Pseudonocardia sp. GCM10023141 TaxID=3252653 RepID=UPI00361C50CB
MVRRQVHDIPPITARVIEHRLAQRLLTAALGLIMIVASGARIAIICSPPPAQVAHAVDVSTIVGVAMWVAIGATSAVLIQPARRVVEQLVQAR